MDCHFIAPISRQSIVRDSGLEKLTSKCVLGLFPASWNEASIMLYLG